MPRRWRQFVVLRTCQAFRALPFDLRSLSYSSLDSTCKRIHLAKHVISLMLVCWSTLITLRCNCKGSNLQMFPCRPSALGHSRSPHYYDPALLNAELRCNGIRYLMLTLRRIIVVRGKSMTRDLRSGGRRGQFNPYLWGAMPCTRDFRDATQYSACCRYTSSSAKGFANHHDRPGYRRTSDPPSL